MKFDNLYKFVEENYTGDFKEDGYCNICDSCGESGCCDSWASLKKHIEQNNLACLHLPRLMCDIEFNYRAFDLVYESIYNSENITEIKEKCDEIFDKLYEEIYGE